MGVLRWFKTGGGVSCLVCLCSTCVSEKARVRSCMMFWDNTAIGGKVKKLFKNSVNGSAIHWNQQR